MTRKSHNPIAKALLTLTVALTLLSTQSCERKDLWLPSVSPVIDLALYDIDLDLYFGFDWRYEWQYVWDSIQYGPIGYTEPAQIRATIYSLDGPSGHRQTPFTRNRFAIGAKNQVTLNSGQWYDMLFYNPDFETVHYEESDSYTTYKLFTRSNGEQPYLSTSTRDTDPTEELPDSTVQYVTFNQPDEVFGTFLEDIFVSEDPADYELMEREDGSQVYVYHIEATLRPYDFIYLPQIIIINNYMDADDPLKPDSTARIKAVNGISISGMAQGIELFTRKDWTDLATITTEDIKPMQTHRTLRLPDGSVQEGDVCAARVLTWGLPGIDPLEARRQIDETGVNPTVDTKNYMGLNITLRKGKVIPKSYNITPVMVSHPTGGVITIVIDASLIPRDIIDEESVSKGGGFNASVDNWSNEVNSEITI